MQRAKATAARHRGSIPFTQGCMPCLPSHAQEETGVPCECNEQVGEMLRGVRQHFAT